MRKNQARVSDIDNILARLEGYYEETVSVSFVSSDSSDYELARDTYPKLAAEFDSAVIFTVPGEVVKIAFFDGIVAYNDKPLHIPSDTPNRKIARAVRYHQNKRSRQS